MEYVFLRWEDEGAGGKSAGGGCGCGCGIVSGLVVRRGKESDFVNDGVNELSGYANYFQ